MSDVTRLTPPHLVMDYKGAIKVVFAYDDVKINCRQAIGFINIPETPVFPRVTVCAIDDSGRQNGTMWTFDPDIDQGRGAWVTYDERIHNIPSSQPLVDAGTESHQLHPDEDEVELNEETAPISFDPPSDTDDELDEPSELDEDNEDEVTAD